MSTDQTSSLFPRSNVDNGYYSEDFSPDEEESIPNFIAYSHSHQANREADNSQPVFLVRKPSQKRFSDFPSTSQTKGKNKAIKNSFHHFISN